MSNVCNYVEDTNCHACDLDLKSLINSFMTEAPIKGKPPIQKNTFIYD